MTGNQWSFNYWGSETTSPIKNAKSWWMWVHRHDLLVSCVQTSIKAFYKKVVHFCIAAKYSNYLFNKHLFFLSKAVANFEPPHPFPPFNFSRKNFTHTNISCCWFVAFVVTKYIYVYILFVLCCMYFIVQKCILPFQQRLITFLSLCTIFVPIFLYCVNLEKG